MMANFDIKKLMDLPPLASEHGKDVDNFIIYVHWLMVALFIGWLAYFLYTLFRFRASRNPKADYQGVKSHASSYLEVAVALIEAVLLVGFAIPLWAKVVDEFPDPAEATVIRVTAEQFAWSGRYPGPDGKFGAQDIKFFDPASNKFSYDPADEFGKDDITIVSMPLHMPVDKPVLIDLTTLDVIHSFAIKQLRVCQDAIPGMSIPVHFKPTVPGGYLITCAQLCGNGHSAMKGYVMVDTPEDYATWMAEQAAASADPGGFE